MLGNTYSSVDKLCRLCMNVHHLSSIFETKGNNMRLDQKISFCRLSLIREDDKLPKYICAECEDKLDKFYDFKLSCESVEIKLRTLICENKDALKVKAEPINQSSNNENNLNDDIHFDVSIEEYCDTLNQTTCHNIEPLMCECNNTMELNSKIKTDIAPMNPLDVDFNNCVNSTKPEDKPIFQCEICGKTFKAKGILKKHIIVHENIKSHNCPLCSKKYTRKDYLTLHLKTHKGIKKYICEICSMRFYNNQDLARHKRIHSDERNYSCERCDKKFKRSFDIISHMRVHTGHRPFVCKFCPKAYKSHSGLKKHGRHHNNNTKTAESSENQV